MGNFYEGKMAKNNKKQHFEYETSIFQGVLYFEDCAQSPVGSETFPEIIDHKSVMTIRLFSLDTQWIEKVWIDGMGYQKELIDMELTIRAEYRSGKKHWYAYRRVLGKLNKRYVGSSENVTQARLLEICQAMPTTRIGKIG